MCNHLKRRSLFSRPESPISGDFRAVGDAAKNKLKQASGFGIVSRPDARRCLARRRHRARKKIRNADQAANNENKHRDTCETR
jgi:hypothetical protein